MVLHTITTLSPTAFRSCARQGCGLPALAHCGLLLPSLTGPLQAFFCFGDYISILRTFQAIDDQDTSRLRADDALTPLREKIVELAPLLLGGSWPSRGDLQVAYRLAEQQYDHAREVYQQADEATPEGRMARMRLLHRAGLYLFAAICLEDRPHQEGLYNTVVQAALFHATSPLLTDENLVMREKAIPRGQVLLALVAICFSRAAGPTREADEIIIINNALQDVIGAESRQASDEPELVRVLALLAVHMAAEKEKQREELWPGLSQEERERRREQARRGQLLKDGLERLRSGKPPTPAQAPLVGEYIQTYQQQLATLRRQVHELTISTEVWQQDYYRLAGEWNAQIKAQQE